MPLWRAGADRAGPGRPRQLCDVCRSRRGRPVPVANWSGPVARAVAAAYPGSDPWSTLARLLAARFDGCQDSRGLVALSRALEQR
ncbi:MAG TPA: hypothetical protein VFG96_00040 [Jiangellaceae bacterium]|nr:hypothetical protein [Jiangellaceae bacterium]